MPIVKISITDFDVFKDLLNLLRKVYQHPQCNEALKSYIMLECKRYFAKEHDIREFLEWEGKWPGVDDDVEEGR